MKSRYITKREECPICSSKNVETLFKKSFNSDLIKGYMEVAYQGNAEKDMLDGVDFEISKCKNCSLVFQPNVLNEDGLRNLYNKWINPTLADEWNRKELLSKNIAFCGVLL